MQNKPLVNKVVMVAFPGLDLQAYDAHKVMLLPAMPLWQLLELISCAGGYARPGVLTQWATHLFLQYPGLLARSQPR